MNIINEMLQVVGLEHRGDCMIHNDMKFGGGKSEQMDR